jgi:hypothetical protein
MPLEGQWCPLMESKMNDEMREYLAKTAQADKERNQRILQQCRQNLIKHKIFEPTEPVGK